MSGSLSDAFGDFIGAGLNDVGDSYQEVLMSNASISAPEGMTGDYEQTVTNIEPSQPEPAQLESYGPPTNDAIPGLDFG